MNKSDNLNNAITISQLNATLEYTPSVAIQWFNSEGKILYWNKSSEQLYGFTSDEAVGKTLKDLIATPDDELEFLKILETIKKTGQPYGPYELTVKRKNGEKAWILATTYTIPLENNEIGFVCMDVEITTQKLSQEQLKQLNLEKDAINKQLQQTNEQLLKAKEQAQESEQRYKEIFDNTFDLMAIYEVTEDNRYKVITFNPAEEKLIGRVDDYLNKYIDECIPPELYNQFQQKYEQCIQAESQIEYEEHITFQHINKTFHTQLIPLKNNKGRVIRIIVISRDITENKHLNAKLSIQNEELKILNQNLSKAKERAEESENRITAMLNAIPDLVFTINDQGVFIDYKADAKDLYYAEGSIIGLKYSDLLPADLVEKMDYYIPLVLRTGQIQTYEYSLDMPQKGVTYYEARLAKSGNNEITAIVRDISLQKKATEELHESRNQFQSLVNNIPGITFRCKYNKHRTFLFISSNITSISGYNTNELVNSNVTSFEKLYFPNDIPLVTSVIETCINADKSWEVEYRLLHKNGSIRWVYEKGQAIRNEQGEILYLDGFILDITDRKNAEELQKNSEKKYQELSTLLRLMADNMPDMLWAKNLNKEFIFANKTICEKLLNATNTHEPLGKTDLYFANRERQAHPDNLQWHTFGEICRDSDNITLTELIANQYDEFGNVKGEYLFLDVHKAPLYDDNGKLIGIVGSARDVTAAKAAENQLRKLSQAVEQSPVSVVISNLKGIIEYVNPKFTEVSGYSISESIGQKTSLLKSGKHPKELYEQLWKTITAGKKWQGEFQNKRKNGQIFWESASISPIIDNSGTISHYVAVKEDITDRKNAEQELIAAKERAEESDKLKTAFLQNMSHEIRTPLNAIVGFSDLLDDHEITPEKRAGFTSIIKNSASQLLSIITDILAISAIETKQEKAKSENVCINDLLIELLSIFNEQATNKNISLYTKQSLPNNQSDIYTDKTKLTQILINLLTNAIKFTHQGYIEFGYTLQSAFLQFYVKDSGIGIENNMKELIFERFRQADKSIHLKYGGTGLGLAISKGLAGLLGGDIWVESEINQGSTFYFTIPYKPVTDNITFVEANIPPINKTLILVAEDEIYNYLYIEEILKTFNFQILHAKNGYETVEMFTNYKDIAIVLMDIKMPQMDGYEAAKIIKALKPTIPIIAQSAYAMKYEVEKYDKEIFDDYITKPINKQLLNNILNKYINAQT